MIFLLLRGPAVCAALLAAISLAVAQDGDPSPPSQEQFEAGQQLYRDRCSSCHGWDMVNLGSYSFDLRKFPKNDEARFVSSVNNGKNAMPAWKGALSDDDIEKIWAYVRTGGKL